MNIKITGGQQLSGEITPSGNKNAIVPILPATLLFDKTITIKNIPNIADVQQHVKILEYLGSDIDWDVSTQQISINNANVTYKPLTEEVLGNMRSSVMYWGAMLARFGKVEFNQLPGGCTLGARPFDSHLKAFEDLGVKVAIDAHGLKLDAKNAFAKEIWLTEMSPTVTENMVIFSAMLEGATKIVGAASEPHVQDLCKFMEGAGANISGTGSSVLEITGPSTFESTEHSIVPDHHEITTFLALGAVTGGEIRVNNAMPDLFHMIRYEFEKFNVKIDYEGETAIVKANQDIKLPEQPTEKTTIVRAQPWPALPVDCLPLFIPLALAMPKGHVMFHNWMYEAGLNWTSELQKMGANVIIADPHRVIVHGGNPLRGTTIDAPYIIRAVVAMAMTAMIAEGTTTILGGDALYRGHPHFATNLQKLGAVIEEVS